MKTIDRIINQVSEGTTQNTTFQLGIPSEICAQLFLQRYF